MEQTIFQQRINHLLNQMAPKWDTSDDERRELLLYMDNLRTGDPLHISTRTVDLLAERMGLVALAVYRQSGRLMISSDGISSFMGFPRWVFEGLRGDKNMSQAEVARRAGMKIRTYYGIEKGLSSGSVHSVERILPVLDARIAYLMKEVSRIYDPDEFQLSERLTVVPPRIEQAFDLVQGEFREVHDAEDLGRFSEAYLDRLVRRGKTIRKDTAEVRDRRRLSFYSLPKVES